MTLKYFAQMFKTGRKRGMQCSQACQKLGTEMGKITKMWDFFYKNGYSSTKSTSTLTLTLRTVVTVSSARMMRLGLRC